MGKKLNVDLGSFSQHNIELKLNIAVHWFVYCVSLIYLVLSSQCLYCYILEFLSKIKEISDYH